MHNTVKDFIVALFWDNIPPDGCFTTRYRYGNDSEQNSDKPKRMYFNSGARQEDGAWAIRSIVSILLRIGFSLTDIRGLLKPVGDATDEEIVSGKVILPRTTISDVIRDLMARFPDKP